MSSILGSVLVGGGSGFIGTAFGNLLRTKGYGVTIVSRMPGPQRMSWTELAESGLPDNTVAVVSLAGQNVLDPTRRWTPGFKQNVWASRVNTTQSLAQAIIRASSKPRVFISISGVGIYEPSETAEYTEDSRGGNFDFLSRLCQEWESVAKLPAHLGVRQVTIRSGVVLGRRGGMIKQLFLPFYLGLGGPVGKGNQYMPWIHIHDLTSLLLFAIENENVRGVLNGVAPQIVTNRQFTKSFGRALWRPTVIPIPEFALNMAFSEERAKIMTAGQKVVPKRTLSYGFEYKYPDIDSACKECAKLVPSK
ncbi:epimerase family protein SDR39U1 [Periplaneta americana]|uniref:epimerase family protein SDR39U1 n=1 Tax=Periplaneta americana TaxID=6978 RepID=UPI0037E80ADF